MTRVKAEQIPILDDHQLEISGGSFLRNKIVIETICHNKNGNPYWAHYGGETYLV